MKHYFAVSFLFVFLYIYVASAATTRCPPTNMMCNFDSCCTDGLFTNGETTLTEVCRNTKYTCTLTNGEYKLTTSALSKMCDGKTTCNKDNFGKYVYCSDDTDTPPYKWEYCKSNFVVETVEDENCKQGYFWHNNQCNSCAEITGDSNATTIKPNAVMLSNCVVGTDTTNTYNDEKGEFKYVAQCYVGCTEETELYCTSEYQIKMLNR